VLLYNLSDTKKIDCLLLHDISSYNCNTTRYNKTDQNKIN